MICPHCEASLLRKERPRNTCSKCRRRYALDPKTNPLGLSDLRVRRVLLKLTQQGQVPCTPAQLWYALSRKSLQAPRVEAGCGCGLAVFGGIFSLVGLLTLSATPLFTIAGCLLLVAAVGAWVAWSAGAGRGRPRVARAAFRSGPLQEWVRVYGSLPPGLVDDTRYPPLVAQAQGQAGERPARGGPVLVCPDPSIAVFLNATGLPAGHGVTIVPDPAALPAAPRGPVLLLHDADAAGLLLADRFRAAYPGLRAVDVGLPLSPLERSARAVPLRGPRPAKEVVEALRHSGRYSPRQLKWLSRGWGYPLIGIPPAKLLAAVQRAAERAGAASDPQYRKAASVGFTTWPGAAG